MTGDYYAPHPLLLLHRPLVLVGHPAAGVEQVGRIMSGRTGLPFNHVERGAEALAGASRARILLAEGIARLRDLEAQALGKALRRSPCGVVVLESGLLEDAAWVPWLSERSTVLYLRRPASVLLRRLQERLSQQPGSIPEFMAGVPSCSEELETYLEPRERNLAAIEGILDAGDDSPARVASTLLGSLDRLVDLDRVGS